MVNYDPGWVRSFYDRYGEREWTRWDESPVEQVKWHLHLHYLKEFLKSEDRVLEIGAGAGRFTRELATLVRSIVVADISPVQLELNRQKAHEFQFAGRVESWVECDMCELGPHFQDEEFDAVVCYGGPLSYVFEARTDAVRELIRVTRPGGLLFFSVMSLWGAVHHFVIPSLDKIPAEVNRPIIASGDLTPREGFPWQSIHMFRAAEFASFLEEAGLSIEVMSASNCLSATWDEELKAIRDNPAAWEHLLEMELEACAESGCLDMGTHLIAVCRKPQ